MAVKLRLARRGRKKKPFYHIVAADARAPRDGRFIEKIGSYNPLTSPATIVLDSDRAFDWLQQGAQPTDTVRSILRFKGVLYRKHLMRGVAKGAMTEDEAQKLYEAFVVDKDAKIQDRFEKTAKDKEAYLIRIGGTVKEVEVVVEAPVAEIVEEVAGNDTESVATAEVEETTTEETTTEETTTEETVLEETTSEEASSESTEDEAPKEEKTEEKGE